MEAFRNAVRKRRFHAPSSSVLERDTVFSRYDIAIGVRAAGWGTWFSRKKSNFHRPNSLYFTTTPSTPLLTPISPSLNSSSSSHASFLADRTSRRSAIGFQLQSEDVSLSDFPLSWHRILRPLLPSAPSPPLANGHHRSPSLREGCIQGEFYFCNSSTIGCRDQAIIGYRSALKKILLWNVY